MYTSSLSLLRIPSTTRLASFELPVPLFDFISFIYISLSPSIHLANIYRGLFYFSLHVLTLPPPLRSFRCPLWPFQPFLACRFFTLNSILPPRPVTAPFEHNPHPVEAPLSLSPCPSLFHIPPSHRPSPRLFVRLSHVRTYSAGFTYLVTYLFASIGARLAVRADYWPVVEWRLVSSKGAQNRPTPIHDARLVGPANWNCINSFLRRLLKR